MTGSKYQKAVLRTTNAKSQAQNSLLINSVLGLCGESGEVADLVKKARFQGHNLDIDHFAEELDGVAWYLTATASVIGKNLDDILASNVDKLRKRYPEGFDYERSVHRPGYEGGACHGQPRSPI